MKGHSGRGGRRGADQFDLLIGSRLRQERRLAGKSRQDLGNVLRIDAQIIEQYECGEPIPPSRLAAAAATLGVPISLLFYGDDQQTPRVAAADMERERWLAIRRPPEILAHPGFSQVLPLVKLWKERRGELSKEMHDAIVADGVFARTILVRQLPRTARLIIHHFGGAIKVMRPCEALLAVGRELHDQPDAEYGAWMAESYAKALAERRVRVESCRALVHAWPARTIRARYDRVLIPWCRNNVDLFLMCVSIRRGCLVDVPGDPWSCSNRNRDPLTDGAP